jgi:hypothetical protein
MSSCILLFTTFLSVAQAPQKFSFQGVARDIQGKIISNATIKLRFSIHQGAISGPVAYVEEQSVQTSIMGVFNCVIGSNSQVFTSVEWGTGNYFMQTEMDATGGNNYIDMGTTQMLSVPYSLVANKLSDFDPIIQHGEIFSGKEFNSAPAGPNLIWYPRMGAFRVGYNAHDVTNATLGQHSMAIGFNAKATGNSSLAIGSNSEATKLNSIALGLGIKANVAGGTAVGRFNDDQDPIAGNERLFQIGNGSVTERSNALTILASGKTGIGYKVLEPEFLLDIGGRVRIKHEDETAGIYFNNSSNTKEGFVGMKDDTNIGFYINGSWMLWINSQGDGRIQGQLYANSDQRLKRDFKPLANSLSKLTQLIGQHYFWKDNTKSQELQTGLVAQEVEQYFPELVSTDEKGFKAVNYIGLIPHLIESVKALKAQNDDMASLRAELKELRKMIAGLKVNGSSESSVNTKVKSKVNNIAFQIAGKSPRISD